jgi:hypothetical protein
MLQGLVLQTVGLGVGLDLTPQPLGGLVDVLSEPAVLVPVGLGARLELTLGGDIGPPDRRQVLHQGRGLLAAEDLLELLVQRVT